MAIQVTGTLLNGFQQILNPQIRLIAHLQYRGKISLDAHLYVVETIQEAIQAQEATETQQAVEAQDGITQEHQVGTIQQHNVLYPIMTELQYTNTSVDPYTDLIDALENYVIEKLTETNPTCTFIKF